MFPLRFFIWILLPFMAFSAVGQDSSHVAIDIRRVKLHEDIDGLQSRICALDGKPDKMIVISRDLDLDLLLTDIYTRQTDALQLEIEKNPAAEPPDKSEVFVWVEHLVRRIAEVISFECLASH